MKKRILALCLTVALLLGMMPVISLASDPEVTADYQASYAGSLTVDGALTETQWYTYGKMTDGTATRPFDILWDAENLYIAVKPETADTSFKVTVAGKELTVDKTAGASGITGASSVWDEAVEVKVPMSSLGVTVKNYGQIIAVKLSAGDIAWEGNVALSSTQRQSSYDFTGANWIGSKLGSTTNNVQTRTEDGGINWSRKYAEGITLDASGYDAPFYRYYDEPVMKTGLKGTTIEFDYQADAMPNYELYYLSAGFITHGLCITFASSTNGGTMENQTLLINLTHSNGKVYLTWGDGSATTKVVKINDTGKVLGERFHVSLVINNEGNMDAYIDGAYLTTIESAVVSAYPLGNTPTAPIIRMTHYAAPATDGQAEDGSKDVDFTVWNLSIGKNKGNDILDDLTWDTIKGDNATADAVVGNLNLPATLDNAQIPGYTLKWTSSNEEAMSAAGVVGAVGQDTDVTLTATVEGSDPAITKDFTITIPALAMDATLTQDSITLDAQREMAWNTADSKEFSIVSGMTAKVEALWSTNTLYLMVNYGAATAMDLTLGNKIWSGVALTESINTQGLTGCAKGGIAELKIDLYAAGIILEDYNEARAFQIKLTGSGISAQIEKDTILMVFSSVYYKEGPTSSFGPDNVSGRQTYYYSGGELVHVMKVAGQGLAFWQRSNVAAIDHSKDMMLTVKLNITEMPVFEAAYQNKWDSALQARGIYMWLGDGDANPVDIGEIVIYRTEEGLRVGSRNGNSIPLGAQIGQNFLLGFEWLADNTINIYVDGVFQGTLGKSLSRDYAGINVFSIRAKGAADTDTIGFNVIGSANITLPGTYEKSTLADELNKTDVLAGVDLSDLTEDDTVTLPGSFWTNLGTMQLDWTSDSDLLTLVENPDGSYTGTVKQPNTKVNGYAVLTMFANGKEYWTTEASVVGLRVNEIDPVTTLRVPYTAADMVIDGKTTDEGWSLDIRLLNAANAAVGAFGAQWTTENLYLAVKDAAVENLDPDNLTVVVGGKTVPVTAAGIAGNVAEMVISMEELGIVLKDYGVEIPAKVVLGDVTWEGTLVLTSNDWFGTDGTDPRLLAGSGGMGTVALGTDKPTSNQGVADLGNGWRLYDLYDPAGNNPANIRSYQLYWAQGAEDTPAGELYANFNDRSHPTYTEFDFKAMAMPVYSASEANASSPYYSNYGLTWNVAEGQEYVGSQKLAQSVSMGIYNTEEGLVFCVLGSTVSTVVLNKYVGDQFRIGTSWNLDGSLTLYIDGEEFAHFENAETTKNAYGNNSFIVNLIRNKQAATGSDESFDLYITNISLGKTRGESITDQITEELILGENEDAYSVTEKLNLVTKLEDDQLNYTADVVWTSSDPSVIAADGTVTRPAKGGKQVTLTAVCAGKEKSYTVYVKGLTFDSDVLVVEGDLDTAHGTGTLKDTYFFTFDTGNNSLVLDQKQSKIFNVITLTDSDDENRLNESNLTIWVSDDNENYTRVPAFKILKAENKVYLYDFEAEGRYVKVHYTEFNGAEASFMAPLDEMLKAEWQDVFGDNGEEFKNSTTVTVNNSSDKKLWDEHYIVPAAGITCETGDKYDVRFFLDGELLYHYFDGENFVVRIPEIEAKSSVSLTVLSGNEAAMDIDNKEYTIEIVHGTREVRSFVESTGFQGRWLCELPDGTLVAVANDNVETEGEDYLVTTYSYDGGLTWTEPAEIPETREWLNNPGGLTYDPNNGRLILQGYHYMQFVASDMSASDCKLRFLYSDDLGKTWTRCEDITMLGEITNYVLSYSDPLIVSSYDGEGPNVDMVLNAGCQANNYGAFCCRVAYTCDAGKTWTLGADKIDYPGGEGTGFEGGISEATILESKVTPGKLVLFARCQYANVDQFATTYSLDYGKTWETEATLSSIYTPGTQPILHEFGNEALMFWGGNNVLGYNSHQRMPMSVAVSYDDLTTFENIQDLYARLSLQGMTAGTRNEVINHSVASIGDTVTLVWTNNFSDNYLLRVDNFTDWFYRTKNVYDSFETSSAKAEGWSVTAGTVERSDLHALDGNYSLRMPGGASAVRSVPYLQNGTVTFNLYLNEGSAANIQLQSAYSNEYGRVAPIAFELKNGKISFLGSDTAFDVNIIEGWNEFTFQLDLDAAKPVAELYLNGEKVADAPVDLEIGNYICWLNIDAPSTVLYLDDVTIVDTDTVTVAEVPEDSDACYFAHDLTKVEADPADCEKDGTIEHWKCQKCGKLFADSEGKNEITDITDRTEGHSLKKVDAVAATTEKEGSKEHYICEKCGKAFWDAEGKNAIADMSETVIDKLTQQPGGTPGENPDTGDHFEALPLVIMLAAATAGLAVLIISRKKWMH